MTAKVKIIVAENSTALETAANLFLADKLAENVLDVDWGHAVESRWHTNQVACFITYQE